MLADSRLQAIERLRDAAREVGANAVVAMRFDCNELGSNMTEVAAYGTAVTVQRVARLLFARRPPASLGRSAPAPGCVVNVRPRAWVVMEKRRGARVALLAPVRRWAGISTSKFVAHTTGGARRRSTTLVHERKLAPASLSDQVVVFHAHVSGDHG